MKMNAFRTSIVAVSLLAALALFPGKSIASGKDFTDEAARAANDAVGRYTGDYTLTDQDGAAFRLKTLLSKPLAVNFIYTGCGHACPTIMTSLEKAYRSAGADFGEKFTALTIGLDAGNDTPERMRAFGSRIAGGFKNWRFASADGETVEKLARELGFYFKKTGGGFDHLNLVTVIDTEGRVFKQVYGADIKPEDILPHIYRALSPEKKLYEKKPAGLIERIKLLCYTYDEATGTYKPDYTFFVSVGLGIIVQGVFVLLMLYLFKGRNAKRAGQGPGLNSWRNL